ncbi:hypothetical protein [Myxococcus sp. RHSTA-1-4]|uniref:hypothetical protein n=1 Tax=Myxococcus sp. RHSTA-1-4 TaxID=2874601 RepID=UPI001CBF3F9F|nr:hypothetical protein [Myxococcus sp. RHSTA-1-4]
MVAVIVAAVALGAAPSLAAAPVEAGKVYSGTEGEEVAVVPLAPRSDKKFLIRVRGTGSEFDGKVFPYELNDWSTSSTVQLNYKTQWHGRDYTALHVRDQRYEMYVPGRQQAIRLTYDEKKTQSLKPEEVYSQYQKLQKDGTLAKLMAFDRKGEAARHDKDYADTLHEMNSACGTSVSAAIDWSSVTDDHLKELSISSYCDAPLTAMKQLCTVSNIAKQTVREKVKQVSCRFGNALEPKLEADRVIWTTHKDASNQDQHATRFLKTNL